MNTKSEKNLFKLSSKLSTRGIYISRLRPGDWLETFAESSAVVLQNWPSLSRIQVGYDDGTVSTERYVEIVNCEYVGRGKVRRFLRFLPAWIAAKISPYSKAAGMK